MPVQPPTSNSQPPTQITAFESTVISIFTDAMQTLGLPKSYGEIYGLLFASAEPLGFSEINARLPISKGSVSQGLKALREVGAIVECDGSVGDGAATVGRAAAQPPQLDGGDGAATVGPWATQSPQSDRGLRSSYSEAGGRAAALDHRRRYRPQLELRQLVVAFLQRSVQPQLQSSEDRLRYAEQQLTALTLEPASRALLADRLAKLQTWRRKAAGLLPWITKFLG